MDHQALFDKFAPDKTVQAGVIGTGHFATAVVTQVQAMKRLDVSVVADIDEQAARQAYQRAGFTDDQIAVCDSRQAAMQAFERGQRVIVADATVLMALPVQVVVEATGVPEAGARHGLAAIEHGKHVAMVNKETDVTVGPILHYLARQAGLVYTPVDGDQHGLLIGLVAWARELGLEVLCGGKSRDGEYVYDPVQRTVSQRRRTITLTESEAALLRLAPTENVAEFIAARQAAFADLPQAGGFDLVEMAIAANATGLRPDVESLHCLALHPAEMPDILAPVKEGGILQRRGAIETVTCLRQPHEAGLVGGVFIVVACDNDYSRHILTSKGASPNRRNTTAAIFRPYHLCGVETPLSILYAALLGVSTVATYQPHVDVVMRAKNDLKAGNICGNDHSPDLQALMHSAQAVQAAAPLPFHMGNGNPFAYDIPPGTLITPEMIAAPEGSTLWALRQRQDKQFLEK